MIKISHNKNKSLFKIGFILIVFSYLFLVPAFLFAALGFGHTEAWLWYYLAAASYVMSWILFIAGFLMAGREAVRSGRYWILKIFRGKTAINPQNDSTLQTESISSEAP